MTDKTTRLLALLTGLVLSATAQSIDTITPGTAAQGTTGLTITFALSGMVPPSDVMPDSVTIGTLSGTSVAHPSQYVVTAMFDVPFGEAVGSKDAVVVFTTPMGSLNLTLTDGFTVTAGADTAPSISIQPQSKTVYEGYTASFSVMASGSAPMAYQWQTGLVDISGGTNNAYSIASASLPNEGDYRCIIVNDFGAATSTVATLTINTNEYPSAGGYAVVDTGQDECCDTNTVITAPVPGAAYAGQDAQYAGNQPSYTLSGDGLTVYDNNTGLTWQRSPDTDGDGDIDASDKLTWTELQTYADTLNAIGFGGFSDWRLPTISAQYSLIDFRGTDPDPEETDMSGLIPFIDTNYFTFAYGDTAAGERIIDSQYASDTLYVADDQTLFGVNFADGRIKGYGLTLNGSDKTFLVSCCRGNPDYGINDFTDNGDGTITDHATGLMWQQHDSLNGMDWADALVYAENLEQGGYRDWRLPNVKELQSLLDYTRSPDTTSSAAIDPLFPCSTITNLGGEVDYPFYWSSTTHLSAGGNAGRGCYVAFGRGLGTMDEGVTIIDIHGAGCQRSDPKTGDEADYPNSGNGPQGDVSRVFNHVRCVRGGATAPTTDSDGDGLTDWYEYNYTSSTTNMEATADDDNDGISNEDEAAAGTIPTDDTSLFRIYGINGSNTAESISWASELDRSYSLQSTTDLVSNAFATVEGGIATTAPTNTYPLGGVEDTVFYRVIVE